MTLTLVMCTFRNNMQCFTSGLLSQILKAKSLMKSDVTSSVQYLYKDQEMNRFN